MGTPRNGLLTHFGLSQSCEVCFLLPYFESNSFTYVFLFHPFFIENDIVYTRIECIFTCQLYQIIVLRLLFGTQPITLGVTFSSFNWLPGPRFISVQKSNNKKLNANALESLKCARGIHILNALSMGGVTLSP